MTDREKILLLFEVIWDFSLNEDNPLSFIDHIGFDIALISTAHQLPDALLGFYRDRTGDYDVARLERDMDTWAPMVTALEAAAAAKKGTLA